MYLSDTIIPSKSMMLKRPMRINRCKIKYFFRINKKKRTFFFTFCIIFRFFSLKEGIFGRKEGHSKKLRWRTILERPERFVGKSYTINCYHAHARVCNA